MSKRQLKKEALKASKQPAKTHSPIELTFGDPVPVMDRNDFLSYVECVAIDKYYEPPVSLEGLSRTFRAATHHSSPIYVKRNILVSTFLPHKLLKQQDFSRWSLDYLIFGNGYLEVRKNKLHQPLEIKSSLAKFTRRGIDLQSFWFVNEWNKAYEFEQGSIFHLPEPDINQEVYGVPEYLSALNSIWLNESATLFRRKYFENGQHAGYIMYLTDQAQNQTDVDNIRNAMKSARGRGNFRNLFMYAPNGKKDGIQIIPLSEVTAKDEFFNIKNVTRDDMLSAHRVPPQMMGIIPNNTGGFGDVKKASQVFVQNELIPLQERMKEFNEWFGDEVIRFKEYQLPAD